MTEFQQQVKGVVKKSLRSRFLKQTERGLKEEEEITQEEYCGDELVFSEGENGISFKCYLPKGHKGEHRAKGILAKGILKSNSYDALYKGFQMWSLEWTNLKEKVNIKADWVN